MRDLSEQMALSRPEARALKKLLRDMVRNGELLLTRKGLYGPPEEMDLVTGYFEAHRDGFGFVISEKPGERDIFIPPGGAAGAMDNDRVIARIDNWKRRGGRIVRIIERAHTRVAGTLDLTGAAPFIRPKSRSIPFDLYVAPQDRGTAGHGDRVIAEIVSYPTDKRPPAARILKVVKRPEGPADEVEALVDEFSLPGRFPRAAAEEAKLLAGGLGKGPSTVKRKDCRDLQTVTIDGERARDFDDAVSISREGHGYRLWVHIADVGHYVVWDSALDLEARRRGTSVYLPDRVVPMLPRELSEDLCSLRPREDRFSFTVEMDFDRFGSRTAARCYPSVIRSDERMTYTAVRQIVVDHDADQRQRYGQLVPAFEIMAELCGILRERRLARGSLDFDLPEPEVILDLQGNPEAIVRSERNFAHMIIEEFMIAANEAVAEYLEGQGVPCLFRIHEEPDPLKLEEVLRVVKALGRFPRKEMKAGDFPALLKAIKGAPEEEVINYIILRSLKQARYSVVNVGHFGLASASYLHFTSPIRRYPDLVVHRILREVLLRRKLSDRRMKALQDLLPDIAFSSSRLERRADDAERAVVNALRAWFMKDRVGEIFPGRIVGVNPHGLRVRLREFYVEGFLRLSYLTDDFYQYNDKTMSISGRHMHRSYKIGQDVEVRLDRVDLEEREIIFGMVG